MRTDFASREQRVRPPFGVDSTEQADFKRSAGDRPRSRSKHRRSSKVNQDAEDPSSPGIPRKARSSHRPSSSTSPGRRRRDTRGSGDHILPHIVSDVHRPGTTGHHDPSGRGSQRQRQSRSRSRSRSRCKEGPRSQRRAIWLSSGDEEEKGPDGITPDVLFTKSIRKPGDDEGGSIKYNAGNFGGGAVGGMEPAVKGCGIMTTATFFKLAGHLLPRMVTEMRDPVTLFLAVFYGCLLWTVYFDPSTGKLCSFHDPSMCATSTVSRTLLTVSRVTAGALFPSITCCILSKCYATRYFLHHSWLSLVVSLEPAHNLHTFFGVLTLACALVHSVAHVARVIYDDNPSELIYSSVDRSGIVALLMLLPVALPMLIGYLKTKLTYEFRKLLHMLFIPFIVAICFHTPTLRLVGSFLLVWYLVDRLYFTTKMTFHIKSPFYKTVGKGTFVRFDLPEGYQFKVGAYIQVNCPAISVSEWHPFSLFPVPGPGSRAGFHVEAVGDWTLELFKLSLENPQMPLWITAAQPSVLEKSIYFDNVLLVCTGAGITPAVSVAEMFAKKKNVHLMWLTREASMIAMFEKQLRNIKSTIHLTGKPSEKTKRKMIDLLAPPRSEVVAIAPRVSSRHTSRSSSCPDLTALEAGDAGSVGEWEFCGSLRGETNTPNDGEGGSVLGGSMLGASLLAQSALEGSTFDGDDSRRKGRLQTNRKRSRGLHPVSVNFGRPDMERFIANTIKGTAARAEWADAVKGFCAVTGEAPPATIHKAARRALARLNTNQRISKADLMSADLSVVSELSMIEAKAPKGRSISGAEAFNRAQKPTQFSAPAPDPSTWLVLYCGANVKVEQAVASVCSELNVTWRKEYFSAW